MLKIPALCLAAALAAVPPAASAQEADVEDGFNLIEEGAKLLLKGLAEEIEPMMKDLAIEMEPKMRALAEEMAPVLEQLGKLVDNMDAYHPPERLPNGDIILRRKAPTDPGSPEAPEVGEEGETEI